EIVWPGGNWPIGIKRVFVVAGTAGKRVDDWNFEFRSQLQGLDEQFVCRTGNLLLRMERVVVATERADHQTGIFNLLLESFLFCFIFKQFVQFAMGISREAASSQFNCLDAF